DKPMAMRIPGTPVSPAQPALPVTAATGPRPAAVPERRTPHGSRLVIDPRRPQPKRSVTQAMEAAEAKVNAYLQSPFAAPRTQIAVMVDGELGYSKGLGLKNVETGEPATADTLYAISSITKTFTAGCIHRLIEAGKLTLDTPIASVIPELLHAGGDGAATV